MQRFFLYIKTRRINGLYHTLIKTSNNFTMIYEYGVKYMKIRNLELFVQDLSDLSKYPITATEHKQPTLQTTKTHIIKEKRYFATFSSSENSNFTIIGASNEPYPSNYIFTNSEPKSYSEAEDLFDRHYQPHKTSYELYNDTDSIDDRQIDVYDSETGTISTFHTDNASYLIVKKRTIKSL